MTARALTARHAPLAMACAAALAFGLAAAAERPLAFAVVAVVLGAGALVAWRPAFGLAAAVALMPLEAAGRIVPGVDVLTFAKLVTVATFVLWALRKVVLRERIEAPPRFAVLVALWYVALAASLLSSFAVSVDTAEGLFALAGQMMILLLFFDLVRDIADIRRIALAVMAGSVVVTAIGLAEIALGQPIVTNEVADTFYASGLPGIFRITATFYDPNALGRYLAWAFFVTLGAMALPGMRRWVVPAGALMAAQLYLLANTFSRGSILAVLLVGAAFIAFGLSPKAQVRAAFVMSAAFAGAAVAFRRLVGILLGRFADAAGGPYAAGGRPLIWRMGAAVWARSPLLGYGIEHPHDAIGLLASQPTSPHSMYLEMLLSVGLLGAVALGLYIVPPMRTLWRARRGPEGAVARLVLMAFGSVLVVGLSLHSLRSNELWLSLALFAPAVRLVTRTADSLPAESGRGAVA